MPEEYSAVFKGRRVIRGERFDLHYLVRPAVADGVSFPPRLGLVVPKRLARTAVLRNAVKRQAREVFRGSPLGAQGLRILGGIDVVLKLSRPLSGARVDDPVLRAALRGEFESLLRRLGERGAA